MRVLVISGSDRRQYNCPGVDSKSRSLMLRMVKSFPSDWHIDFEDLGNVFARARIQSCNACVSTSMALCVWPCNCYEAENKKEPDLMWDLDLYSRLDQADAWAIIGPVNWYGPTSNLKLMFDRLVCMSGGNPKENLINHKDPELAMKLEHTSEWEELSQNHLEGRTAGFFCYGDGGGDEIDSSGKPKILQHKNYFDSDKEPFKEMRDAYAPLVWQCRYGGIEVPDALWRFQEFGRNRKYSDNQAEHLAQDSATLEAFDHWTLEFRNFVEKKGVVKPGRFRAVGYKAPSHKWADVKLKFRELRMSSGHAPKNSSPRKQNDLELNHDATFDPKSSSQSSDRDRKLDMLFHRHQK